jgi:hypothetical protein
MTTEYKVKDKFYYKEKLVIVDSIFTDRDGRNLYDLRELNVDELNVIKCSESDINNNFKKFEEVDTSIYCVTITEHEDDYKCRSGSWSETADPKHYSSYEKAKLYLCEYIIERFDLNGLDFNNGEEIDPKYLNDDGTELSTEYKTDLNKLEELVEQYKINDGEYCSQLSEWYITTVVVE